MLEEYNYKESADFNGLVPEVMKLDGVETIGGQGDNNLEIIDFEAIYEEEDDKKYVDMGLPSGTLWAKSNLGATNPYKAGLYFAWGETDGYSLSQVSNGKKYFYSDFSDYKFYDIEQETFTKYNSIDKKIKLDKEDDAAVSNLGYKWQMPTVDQFYELLDNTTITWDSKHGGIILTSNINGNKLFFYTGGGCFNGEINGIGFIGAYWSKNIDEGNEDGRSTYLYFRENEDAFLGGLERFSGINIRPILHK